MQVVYTGSVKRVFIPLLRDLEVTRGVPVEVPDEIGLQLIEQRTWSRSDAPPPPGDDPPAPFSDWTVEDLKSLASELGLTGYAGLRKAELVAMVEDEVQRLEENRVQDDDASE